MAFLVIQTCVGKVFGKDQLKKGQISVYYENKMFASVVEDKRKSQRNSKYVRQTREIHKSKNTWQCDTKSVQSQSWHSRRYRIAESKLIKLILFQRECKPLQDAKTKLTIASRMIMEGPSTITSKYPAAINEANLWTMPKKQQHGGAIK